MPPTLALILTLGFIAVLFRRDFREKPDVTHAIWLPILWMFIIASRPVTQWLHIFGFPGFGGASVEEGSSLDALVYAGLIALGIFVLNKRQVSLGEIVQDNSWLAIFVLYCLLAVFWSDFPFVSFKRWIKVLGHPIMVLILFTEPDPMEALVRLMKRVAYVVVPVSILWMKYYPQLGRKASEWGAQMNCGIAEGKNELGGLCLILGLFFMWYFLQVWRMEKNKSRRNEIFLVGGLLLMIGYCLRKAHSSTAVLSVLLGAMVMIFLSLRFVNKKVIGVYAVVGIAVVVIAQMTFDVYGSVVDLTGHGATIEGRGRLWEVLWKTDTDPIFGAGFESYWLGERLQKIWSIPEFRWRPTQAHNGYLEAYINLGAIGFLILAGVIVTTFRKCRQDLLLNFGWGRLTMSYLIAILAHNWTEAGFKGLSLMFFFFFMVAVNYPRLRIGSSPSPVETESPELESELAYSGGKVW